MLCEVCSSHIVFSVYGFSTRFVHCVVFQSCSDFTACLLRVYRVFIACCLYFNRKVTLQRILVRVAYVTAVQCPHSLFVSCDMFQLCSDFIARLLHVCGDFTACLLRVVRFRRVLTSLRACCVWYVSGVY